MAAAVGIATRCGGNGSGNDEILSFAYASGELAPYLAEAFEDHLRFMGESALDAKGSRNEQLALTADGISLKFDRLAEDFSILPAETAPERRFRTLVTRALLLFETGYRYYADGLRGGRDRKLGAGDRAIARAGMFIAQASAVDDTFALGIVAPGNPDVERLSNGFARLEPMVKRATALETRFLKQLNDRSVPVARAARSATEMRRAATSVLRGLREIRDPADPGLRTVLMQFEAGWAAVAEAYDLYADAMAAGSDTAVAAATRKRARGQRTLGRATVRLADEIERLSQ